MNGRGAHEGDLPGVHPSGSTNGHGVQQTEQPCPVGEMNDEYKPVSRINRSGFTGEIAAGGDTV